MARPLQKKKNKSSLPRVRQKPKSKAVNIKSNPIVAANWDQSLTLRQNYRQLGLTSRLNSSTGGVEKRSKTGAKIEDDGGFIAPRNQKSKQLEPTRVKVVRDATGAIVRLVREDDGEEKKRRRRRRNPLNDPLNDLSSAEEEEEGEDSLNTSRESVPRRLGGAGIVPELEESTKFEKRKRPRKQSQREQEWIRKLVDRYGEDYGAMVMDRKLNPMQQSEGDLKKRAAAWRREERERREDEIMDEG